MNVVNRFREVVGPRTGAKCGAWGLSFLLALPGLALILGGPRYHHPFALSGAHFLEGARNIAPISIWGSVLLVAGIFVPLMFSRDSWVLGVAGCAIGFVVTFFLTFSFIGEVPPGWFSASVTGPLCAVSAGATFLSIYDHVEGHGGGHAAGT